MIVAKSHHFCGYSGLYGFPNPSGFDTKERSLSSRKTDVQP